MSFSAEEWRDGDNYAVSSEGKVRSRLGRILSPWPLRGGVLAVKIDGKTYQVHHLILKHFKGVRPEGAVPWWSNGDVADNRAVNLSWRVPGDEPLVRSNRCRKGHVLERENVRLWGRGNRVCVACERGDAPVFELPEVL